MENIETVPLPSRKTGFQRTGISNAMAQPYFHNILPLASERDKNTLILWGIKDYTKRLDMRRRACGCLKRPWTWPLGSDGGHGIDSPFAPWQARSPPGYHPALPGGIKR